MTQHSAPFASPAVRLLFVAAAVIAATLALTAQSAQPGAKPKTAAEEFKNIQILKDAPADQMIPTMQFIAASLNVECEFCHVQRAFEKDDKKEKKMARQMMTMMFAINKDNFKGEREVTCYTCHQGNAHPPATPAVQEEVATTATTKAPHEHHGTTAPTITADAIIAKYMEAIGGQNAAAKVTSRIQKGTAQMGGQQMPVEIYTKAPDKRVAIVHMPNGDSATAVNGTTGWLAGGPRPPHDMSAAESAAALIDTQILLGVSPKQMFKDFRVARPDKVGDKEVNVLIATHEGLPPMRLYFDAQSGLLLRLLRFQETPLGRNPTQVDYADYRDAGGVKTPYRWTIARPGSRFTIQVESAQQNVPVDDTRFAKPAAPATPAKPGTSAQ